MGTLTNRAAAVAFAISLICGSASVALADGKGHDGAKGHGSNHHSTMKQQTGNSSTAHSCVNPAGNARGWCQAHVGGNFVTGRVTAVNGSTATILMPNGQTMNVNAQYLMNQGQALTVGQQVTLRGSWQNGVFVVNTGTYNNYGGPYSGASVKGMILSVSGNTIKMAQGLSLITINDATAVSNGSLNGSLFPGRTITASGNWNGSTFEATSIQ